MTLKGKRAKKKALTKSQPSNIVRGIKKAIASLRTLAVPDKDYWAALPKPHRMAISVIVFLLFLLVVWPENKNEEDFLADDGVSELIPSHLKSSEVIEPDWVEQDAAIEVAEIEPKDDAVLAVEDDEKMWVSHKVAPGDTLAEIFRAQKLPLPDLYAITAIEGRDKPLSYIQPGQRLRFKRNAQGKIETIQVETVDKKAVVFSRGADGRFARR